MIEANNDIEKGLTCRKCLNGIFEPVITLCGHSFCWSCLYNWRVSRKAHLFPCPVCNMEVSVEMIVPLYVNVNPNNRKNKMKALPPRPHPNLQLIEKFINTEKLKIFDFTVIRKNALERPLFRYNIFANPNIPSLFRIIPISFMMSLPWVIFFSISKRPEDDVNWIQKLLRFFISKVSQLYLIVGQNN